MESTKKFAEEVRVGTTTLAAAKSALTYTSIPYIFRGSLRSLQVGEKTVPMAKQCFQTVSDKVKIDE